MMRKMTHKLSVPVIINNQGIGVSVPELVVPFYRHEKGGGMLLVGFLRYYGWVQIQGGEK